jgi:tRNA pseudouridine32 synthase / 23S rRNA pseudouridine746 synthase
LLPSRHPQQSRNGVSPSVIVLPSGGWPTVLDFLDERFPNVSRDEIVARMLRGDVQTEDGNAVAPTAAYQAQQKLYYFREILDEPRLPVQEQVLFEDEFLVVADKPHFLPVTPGGKYLQETLLIRLRNKLSCPTLAPMHRIDRETAGLVLFTKQPNTRGQYQSLFESRSVEKSYEAIAPWQPQLWEQAATPVLTAHHRIAPAAHFMQMCVEAGEPNAICEIMVLERHQQLARYQLRPQSGKKHQLRVQMMALGMPILFDQIYPNLADSQDENWSRPLQLLAKHLAFTDPITGARRDFTSARRLLPLNQLEVAGV